MKVWTREEFDKVAGQICKRRNVAVDPEAGSALDHLGWANGYTDLYYEAIDLQCELNEARDLLQSFHDFMDSSEWQKDFETRLTDWLSRSQ